MSSEDEPVQRTAIAGHQQLPLAPPPPVPASNPPSAMSAKSAPPSKEPSGGSDGAGTPSTENRTAILGSQKLTEEPKSVETPSSTFATPAAPASNGSHHPPRPSRWTKARSTSTESFVSSMGIPATLGSQYNQEGFPNYPVSSEDEDGDVRIAADDEAIAKQLAQTDEAVRQINGTASVVQRNFGNMMPSAPSSNQYELPRAAAAYVQRRPGGDMRDRGELRTGGSFVSSGSSTSSEESDFLPGVQWVDSVSQRPTATTFNYPFYYTGKPSSSSNTTMPPPSIISTRKPPSPGGGNSSSVTTSGPLTPNPGQREASADGTGDNDEDDHTAHQVRTAEPPTKRPRYKKDQETPDSSLRIPPSDPSEDSDLESPHSASESEYNAGKKRIRRYSKDKGSRVRPTLPMLAAPVSPSSSKDSPAPATKKPPKVRRPSTTSDGKPPIPAGGVQCEYVNPLPPYQRCPDVFTRKYDIPRHMARHARREGDLVQEGKLPEEKAMLWKTIRDKPRIRCKVCLEYFTRQDALKRHQNKQHHH
ncbi:hypothetical protein CC85DRAFT_86731 [Cutaneotrichosporon oleaginosum]|uniref:C2H2-type domain-containing protein n=1 Tax=Cutaneotrichosporon oleaginosum TaxID=879819 RepID=A0A0J1BCQ9_9TREE|nr:uncharacterized protein CC85DRAFT_86731 [Cutaneotrichosporon oleaginosum]KLT45839.1 hypothetical protein CC85DRAFT_86731 [Cutaneotrichosporon oleaginosum]TXT06544.1 hypothetical protein COLE_05875 [Cutaneotrichosporon oleaginosum]